MGSRRSRSSRSIDSLEKFDPIYGSDRFDVDNADGFIDSDTFGEDGKRSLSSRFQRWREQRRKTSLDQRFTDSYGAEPVAEDSGPRAAVYEGVMGRSQRRSQRMQSHQGSSVSRSHPGAPSQLAGFFSKPKAIISLSVCCFLIFSICFLYSPVRTYYQQVREHDRLQAEYTAILDRNDAIQQQIDVLSTDSGVQDRARSEYGWVEAGENSLSVAGLDLEETAPDISGNILSNSVRPPTTWYSPFLDPLFGVT